MSTLNQIIKDIFELDDPKIEENRRDQIQDFIKKVINGDSVQGHLVIDANLKNKKEGVLVYILTNARIIKIEISEGISSQSFFLNALVSVGRKLEKDQEEVEVIFQNTSFGLRYYPEEDEKISQFFQKIDQVKAMKGS